MRAADQRGRGQRGAHLLDRRQVARFPSGVSAHDGYRGEALARGEALGQGQLILRFRGAGQERRFLVFWMFWKR